MATRQHEIEQLFVSNYGSILDMALTADSNLFVKDGENVVQGVAEHLSSYDGLLDSESFLTWAEEIIQPAVAKLSAFYRLREQYSGSVLKGVWSVLSGAKDLSDCDDMGYTARTLADKTWLWVFENLSISPETGRYELATDDSEPATAELATRLYQKGYWAARAWKTDRLRSRAKNINFESFLKETANMANAKPKVLVS